MLGGMLEIATVRRDFSLRREESRAANIRANAHRHIALQSAGEPINRV